MTASNSTSECALQALREGNLVFEEVACQLSEFIVLLRYKLICGETTKPFPLISARLDRLADGPPPSQYGPG